MKKYKTSISSGISTVSRMCAISFCMVVFFVTVSAVSTQAQWCPSIYNVYRDASGTGIYTTGSDVGVDYRIHRNGYIWDVMQMGTGDFLYWSDLCTGAYTIVAYKAGCPDLILNFGVPVNIVGSCPDFSAEATEGTSSSIISDSRAQSEDAGIATSASIGNGLDYAWSITPSRVIALDN